MKDENLVVTVTPLYGTDIDLFAVAEEIAIHEKEALRRGEVTTNELRVTHGLSTLEDGVAGNRLKQFD